MSRFCSVFILSLLSFSLFAAPTGFNRHFQLIRDQDGKLQSVIGKSVSASFSIRPLIEQLKEDLKAEQSDMARKGNYQKEVNDLLFSDSTLGGAEDLFALHNVKKNNYVEETRESREVRERRENAFDALEIIRDLDIEAFFAQPELKKLVDMYEIEVNKHFRVLNVNMLANVVDSQYFYRTTVNYQILMRVLNYARKQWSNIPVLNVATMILEKMETMFTQQRFFYQNMLLHYIENYSPEELGLSAKEEDRIISSIYESRITWLSYFESKAVQRDWDGYGVQRFYREIRGANSSFRGVRGAYSEVGERINFAFQEATFEEQDLVINLFDKAHMFSKMPSVAFDKSNPKKVLRKRQLIQVVQVGARLLPIPKFLQSTIDSFFSSMYLNQSIREGALMAYFEEKGDERAQKILGRQVRNPFIFIK